ncbi:MAG: OmpA family protein [Bacteroidetes bacterium]|nr:OmpA family protein [Bacteroidota bacterium]
MKPQIVSTKAFFQKVLLLFASLLMCVVSFAQKKEKNLVPNPSFEKHKNKTTVIKNAAPWVGVGTVDYFMKVEKKDTSKSKGAHTGTCYAGLRFQPNYKEYMFVKLTEPLEKEKMYNFIMHVKLVRSSTVTVKQLGVYFSDKPFKVGMSFNEEGIIDSTYGKGISGGIGWTPIQGEYKAHGGEKYIIIGNFKTRMKDDFVRIHKWNIFKSREAYYYVDDISVIKKMTAADSAILKQTEINPDENKTAYIVPDTFTTGQIIEIKNIHFEHGSANLLKSSFNVLDELVRVLNDHPNMEIQINGHTDDQGKEAVNRKLSKARAKAVYDYLVAQSVINSMAYKGFGPSQPLVPNDTDENKAKNRRVEFLIIKQ